MAIAVAWSSGACGRLDFSPIDGPHDAALSHDGPGATTPRIGYLGPFVERADAAGATVAFDTNAIAAGSAIVIQVTCAGPALTTVSVTAPGWTFTMLGPPKYGATSALSAATVFAIAPDTAMTTVTVSWTSNCASKTELGDGFLALAPATTVMADAANVTDGVGDCLGTVSTSQQADAVWGACVSGSNLTGTGPGFTKGADDGFNDWSEYAITTDPAGTNESVSFSNSNISYLLSMATLKPQ
jgi:hypothetical protein